MAASRGSVEVTARLRNARKFAADARNAAREVDGIGAASRRAGGGVQLLNGNTTRLARTMRMAAPVLFVGAVGAATQAVSGLSAGVVGLASAIAPAAGIIGGLPFIALAAGQGVGALALAMRGVTDAVGGLNEEMDPAKLGALSREGQEFALQLHRMKAPILAVQKSIQRGMFPGLTKGLRSARPALAALKGPLEGTGRAVGGFGAQLGALVGSKGFLNDLADQARFNNTQLTRMGGAGVHVVSMLRTLAVGARPLVSWMVKLAAGWAQSGDGMLKQARHSGALRSAFDTIRVAASRVGRIVADVTVALFRIGQVGKKAIGDDMLKSLVGTADGFRQFTESAKGQAKIRKWFLGWREFRDDVNAAWGVIMKVKPELVGLAKDVRELWMAMTAGDSDGAITVIKLYGQAMRGLTQGLTWIVENVPGARGALSTLLGVMIVAKVVGFGGALTQLRFILRAVTVATTGLTFAQTAQMGVLPLLQAMWLAFGTSTIGVLIGMRIAAAAAWLATLGPAAAIVAGLVAIGAVFYLLYKRVGWFRNAVDAAWKWIKGASASLAGALKSVLPPVIRALKIGFDVLKGAGRGAFTVIRTYIKLLTAPLRWVIDKIGWVIDKAGKIGDIAGSIAGKIPGGDTAGKLLGGAGKLLGFSPGEAATGGVIRTPGAVLVGEEGPELLSMERGARIDPLPRLARGMGQSEPSGTASITGALTDATIRPVEITVPVHLDGRLVYEAVGRVGRDKQSRR